VQCLQVKALQSKQPAQDGLDRYRLILSDVDNFIQSMLATRKDIYSAAHATLLTSSTELNDMVVNGELKKGCLLRINGFQPNRVKDKKILIIMSCEVLPEHGELEKIGAPVGLDPTPGAQDGPQQQPGNVSANGFYGNKPTVKPEQTTQQSLPSRPQNGDSSHQNLYPIEALSPYAHRWTIRARVTHKAPMKTWHNQQGEGRLFSFSLLDESGEIRATVFHSIGDQFDSLYEMLQEGGVYYISSPCQVKMANKRFSQLNNDYELTFDRDTRVEKAEDQSAVPQVRYNFTSIADMQSVENNQTTDVIGILKEVGEVSQIVSKTTSKPFDKRELTIVDDTLTQIRLTIWGAQAQSFDAAVESVLAFKGVKVSDFGGRSLSLLSSGSMTTDPDIDEAHKLKGWYDAQGRNDQFQSHATTMAGGSGQRKDAYKTVVEVKDVLGLDSEKADYFTLKATIVYIKQDNIYYPACPSTDCNKKVTEIDPGQWRCEKCDKSFPKPEYRYIMSLNVQDHTGQMWLSGFDDTGRIVLGKSADEVADLKDAEESKQVESIFEEANCKSYVFRCRAKLDNYRDEQRYAHTQGCFLSKRLLTSR
jgi:replication factor A1